MSGVSLRKLRTRDERDALVEQYLPLVRHVIARLPITMPPTLDRDDLLSVGTIGLMHAATTYDANRGASFKTFAFTAVRGAILDEVRRHDPVPRSRRRRLRRLELCASTLRAQLARAPTLEEIAERLGVSSAELDEDLLALHTCQTLSLDCDLAGGTALGAPLGRTLATETEPDPAELATGRERVARLAESVRELPEQDRRVITLYYHEDLYLKEIGEILCVSESRVSQILSRAIARLRLVMLESPDA